MTVNDHAKSLRGTLRSDRKTSVRHEEKLGTLPPAPDGLSPSAAAAWVRLGALAIDAGTLSSADMELLSLAARTAASCDELERQLAEDGVLLRSNGAVKAHPACAALDRNRVLMLKLLDALGLSPAGREKVPVRVLKSTQNKFAYLKS